MWISIFAPVVLVGAFVRELHRLFKKPQYRALLFWVAMILAGGTVFYHNVEQWGWVDSFYFSVVTLATVGYGDFTPSQPATKLFTTVYIFIGLGFLITFVNLLTKEHIAIMAQRRGDKEVETVLDAEVG